MKKIILSAIVAVASLSASAQVFVGGALGFQSTKANKDAKANSAFTLAPEVGYTFNENWEAGIALGMQFKNNKQGNTIGGDIYGRYHYLKTGIASLFVELNAGIDAVKGAGEGAQTGTIFGFGIKPGVKIALSDKVALVAKTGLLGAEFANEKAQALGYNKTGFAIGVNNVNIDLGVYYSF